MTKKELEKKVSELEIRLSFHIDMFNEYCVFLGTEIQRLEHGQVSETDRLSSNSPIDPPPDLRSARLTTEVTGMFTPFTQLQIPGSKVTALGNEPRT